MTVRDDQAAVSAAGSDQSGVPLTEQQPAAIVLELAAGRPVRCVWANGIGGLTWQIDQAGIAVEYVKVGPPHPEFDPAADQQRLDWVRRWASAPQVWGHGQIDTAEGPLVWLHTRALPGRTAISHDFEVDDEQIIRRLGVALRQFHDRGPVVECRWTWSVADRLGLLPATHELQDRPTPPLDLVVAHGDACNPNFLFDDAGQFTGYVDLGRVGVADRWADLAPALLSLGWNFGPDREQLLLEGYGIELDAQKLDYYTALWNSEDPPSRSRPGSPAAQ